MISLSAHNPTVEAFLPGCRRCPIKDHRNQLPSKGSAGESPDFFFMITHYIVSTGCSFSFCQTLTISIFISSSELFQEQMVLSSLPYTFFQKKRKTKSPCFSSPGSSLLLQLPSLTVQDSWTPTKLLIITLFPTLQVFHSLFTWQNCTVYSEPVACARGCQPGICSSSEKSGSRSQTKRNHSWLFLNTAGKATSQHKNHWLQWAIWQLDCMHLQACQGRENIQLWVVSAKPYSPSGVYQEQHSFSQFCLGQKNSSAVLLNLKLPQELVLVLPWIGHYARRLPDTKTGIHQEGSLQLIAFTTCLHNISTAENGRNHG